MTVSLFLMWSLAIDARHEDCFRQFVKDILGAWHIAHHKTSLLSESPMRKRTRPSKQVTLEENRSLVQSARILKFGSKFFITWAAGLIIAVTLIFMFTASSLVGDKTFAADPVQEGKSPDDPRNKEVETFIRRYFRTWSSQDLKGYGECFLNSSSIQFIDPQGKVELSSLPTFLASQGEFMRRGERATEAPVSIDIRFESKLARAIVYWKLTSGSREVFGYDHFTLLKQNGEWGIVNLVFYETKRLE